MAAMNEVEEHNVARLTQAASGGIQSADTKATALVSLGAALLAIVAGLVALRSEVDTLTRAGVAMIAGFTVFTLAAVLAACAALYPRVDRKWLLESRGWSPLAVSPSYFNDIVRLDRARFVELMSQDASEDFREQAYVLCIIADRKMHWLRRSVIYFVIACIFLTFFVVTGVLAPRNARVEKPPGRGGSRGHCLAGELESLGSDRLAGGQINGHLLTRAVPAAFPSTATLRTRSNRQPLTVNG